MPRSAMGHPSQKANRLPCRAANSAWGARHLTPVNRRPNLVTVWLTSVAVEAGDALCGQAGATPWHCATNSSTARPSQPLCRPATHCAGGPAPLRRLYRRLQSSSHDETLERAWEHPRKGVRTLTGRGPRSELPLEITSGQAQKPSRRLQKPELVVNSSRRPMIRKDNSSAWRPDHHCSCHL